MLWWVCFISNEFSLLFSCWTNLTSLYWLIFNSFNLFCYWNIFSFFLLDICSFILRNHLNFSNRYIFNFLYWNLFSYSLRNLFNYIFISSHRLIFSYILYGIIFSDSLLFWYLFNNNLFFIISINFLIWNIFNSCFTLYWITILNCGLT